jgi:hypothetical protein
MVLMRTFLSLSIYNPAWLIDHDLYFGSSIFSFWMIVLEIQKYMLFLLLLSLPFLVPRIALGKHFAFGRHTSNLKVMTRSMKSKSKQSPRKVTSNLFDWNKKL